MSKEFEGICKVDCCERVQKSIDYIEYHLKDDIDVSSVIQQSYYSTTHFYRIFRALVGDSLKDYIKKRRLSTAVIELCITNKRLIEIAVDYGFNSQEVFTRAFFKEFGITPGRYRKEKSRTILYEKVNVSQKLLSNLNQGVYEQPQIIFDKEFKIVGMKSTVKPGDYLIRNLWAEFFSRKSEINNVTNMNNLLGLCEYMPNIKDDSEFAYIACIETTCFRNIPEGMVTKTVPKSKYAVFTHKGPIDCLKGTYDFIYGAWLPQSGYELAELDTIELYTLNTENSDFQFDIYIPLKK